MRFLSIFLITRIRRTFIQHHHDIRTKRPLDIDDIFRCEPVGGAVDMRTEHDPIFIDPSKIRKAEDLVPATICEDRPLPGCKPVQPACLFKNLASRSEIQMVSISQDNLGAEFNKFSWLDGLHSTLRSDGHENRRLDLAMVRQEFPSPSLSVCMFQKEVQLLKVPKTGWKSNETARLVARLLPGFPPNQVRLKAYQENRTKRIRNPIEEVH